MKLRFVFLAVVALLGSCVERGPKVYRGIYSQAMEHQGFTAEGEDVTWWVEGNVAELNKAAVTPMGDGKYMLEGKVFAVVEGELSEKGEHGHLGMYPRALRVSRVIEIRPITNDKGDRTESGDSPNGGPATSVDNSDGSGGGRHR